MAGGVRIFENVLLASDFDGTLVPSSKEITPGVREAIRFFIENGGRFTICTGRIYHGFHVDATGLVNAPILLANGAMAYDYAQDRILFENSIGDEGIEPLRAIARDFPSLCIEINPFHQSYVVNPSEQSDRHLRGQGIPFSLIADPADAPRPWCKAMLGGSPEEIARAQDYLAGCFREIHFLSTAGNYLEILAKGADKGTGLMMLADCLGIAYEDVYAIGDGYNDVEMLRAAHLAFVPENGDASAKACADHIVRSNEQDAVAHAIELLTELYCKRATH